MRKIGSRSEAALSLALNDTANFILTLIRIYAPVDTGWLRDSYKKESESALHIIVGTLVSYSIHQEFGLVSGRMRFTPHMRPAGHQGEGYLPQAMLKRAKELL